MAGQGTIIATLKPTGRQWRQTDIPFESLTLLGIIMNKPANIRSRKGKGCGYSVWVEEWTDG